MAACWRFMGLAAPSRVKASSARAAVKSGRVAIVLDLTPASLIAVTVLRVARVQPYVIQPLPASGIMGQIARGLGVSYADAESLGFVEFSELSRETPAQLALREFGRRRYRRFISRLSSDAVDPQFVERVLEVALLREAQLRSDRLFVALLTGLALGERGAVLVTVDPWDSRILRNSGIRVSVLRLPSFTRVATKLKMAWQTWSPSVRRRPREMHDDEASTSPHADHSARVILVLNRGMSYGRMFSYDYLYEAGSRDLSQESIAHLSLLEGSPSTSPPIRLFPHAGSSPRSLLRAAWLTAKCIDMGTRVSELPIYYFLARTILRSRTMSRVLRTEYPAAKVAVLAYDLQVPMDVLLALEFAGVTTVALNERPHSLFETAVAFGAKRLLVASEKLSDVALDAPHVAIASTTTTGMWRTDLLVDRMRATGVGVTQPDQHILVLPFGLAAHGSRDLPFLFSPAAVAGFLSDITALAEAWPRERFVIRAKTLDWLKDARIAGEVDRFESLANCVVSTDYSRMYVQYELCASAKLVLGKPTSLIEEALAVGVPCILHDFSPTSSSYYLETWRHVPREFWALSRAELLTKTGDVLSGLNIEARNAAMSNVRSTLGGKNDGHVRERVRSLVRDMVQEADRTPH